RAEERIVGARRPQECAFFRVLGPEHLDLANVAEGKPTSQGDNGRRPSRKLSDRVGALRVARPSLAGHARGPRRAGPEFLLPGPPRLIELMDTHVDEYSAAVGAEVS